MARRRSKQQGSAVQLSLGMDTPHRNRGLFADHFLNSPERLPSLPEWQDVADIKDTFVAIRRLYEQRAMKFNPQTNEPQTEHDFIRPVLDLLWQEALPGDCYQVQVSIPALDMRRQPDYALFRTATDRNAAEARKGTLDYWRDMPALADAKRWGASLDKQRGADENPSAQVCNYLYRSRVRWGILTNGRHWRLYEREKSSAGGIYYEVDLVDLLQRGDPEGFKYFYLFFRREAFLPGPDGVSFVEKVFQGSADYATAVGDRLKESVYDALRLLMNGFFEHAGNRLDRNDPATLNLVHENCLILLYRLLFLLYAEDRDLLPCRTEPYASYSLYRLQREINQHLRAGGTYPPVSHRFWGELTNLFQLIDTGFPEGDIPAYNGGLFSPTRYPHIAHTPILPPHSSEAQFQRSSIPAKLNSSEAQFQPQAPRWEIGDHRLAEVIDLLAYERDRWNEPGSRDVDYTTLQVQHLGSIYEGLLELQPHIAPEPLVETTQGGKSGFKPMDQVDNPDRPVRGQPPRRIAAGEVYLVTDRGERKATGSYYTPKYIVDYIVEHAVGPLADEAATEVANLRPEVEREIRRLEQRAREFADNAAEVEKAQRGIEEQQRRLLEPYLSLKILDPAMGSGHFLVGAADFLSLAMATDPNLPEDLPGSEDPQTYYKRLLVEHCLYGVDLNPLAVELAKLSLWLHTVSQDRALSFLDHHLRCGNSLVGARLEDDLTREPPQLDARGRIAKTEKGGQLVFGFTEALTGRHLQYFLDTFRRIVEAPTGDAEVERQKDHWFREMDRVRDRFRRVANLWLALYFGEPVTAEEYEQAVQSLRDPQSATRNPQCAVEKRFFHWELEFPEVFFDATGWKPREERGFDAVMGNPPYVRIQLMPEEEVAYYAQAFTTPQGTYDIYVLFIEQAVALLRQQGRLGFINPHKFIETRYGAKLRSLMARHCNLVALVDFGDLQVFDDAVTYVCLLILEKCEQPEKVHYAQVTALSEGIATLPLHRVSRALIEGDEWHIRNWRTYPLLQKIAAAEKTVPLGDLTRPHYSLFTGLNEAFVVTRQTAEQWRLETPLLKKLLRGQDVKRWEVAYGDLFIIYPYQPNAAGKPEPVDLSEYPQVERYLTQFKADLMSRVKFKSKIREEAERQRRWFEYIDPRSPAQFEEPKLLVPEIADRNTFALDTAGFYCLNKVFAINLSAEDWPRAYVLALLNSSTLEFYFKSVGKQLQHGFYEYASSYVARLPLRRVCRPQRDGDRSGLVAQAQRLASRWVQQPIPETYSDFLNTELGRWLIQQLPLDPEGIPDSRRERSDVVQDLLARLSGEMIKLHRKNRSIRRQFLRWLERYTKTPFDHLSNKTAIRDFDTLPSVNELLELLARPENARQIAENVGLDPVRSQFQGNVEAEYEAAMTILRPMQRTVQATEQLVNFIIYRLYGLTEGEVQSVEEAL